ncbi:hypothetical protein EYF88_13760 [Paracoccus sediminis]|uniref:Uncharacterized protein n=1 Tax=Paracoccus sediminis TaxID=1214787 RepID=A0A238XL27_9RHOB|nr:hypothetical protein [Paracoccus sediminis]TBN48559.1 hypothetical protein EYF88_13760 [Paracoccus sediminis]SNR59024.1 hypothetical protein SAMN06265378_110108 [Paracoccus sediminis]
MFWKSLMPAICFLPMIASVGMTQPMNVTTAEEFNSQVVGKSLVHAEGGQVVINASGQITGVIRGEPITASKWIWDQSKFCRAFQTANNDFPSECQNVVINGNTVRFGRTEWTIQ